MVCLPATRERTITMCATQTIHTRNAILLESVIWNAFFDFTSSARSSTLRKIVTWWTIFDIYVYIFLWCSLMHHKWMPEPIYFLMTLLAQYICCIAEMWVNLLAKWFFSILFCEKRRRDRQAKEMTTWTLAAHMVIAEHTFIRFDIVRNM